MDGMKEKVATEMALLEEKLQLDIDTDFAPWKTEIKELLSRKIILEYHGEGGLAAYSLRKDKAFSTARSLLLDLPRYHRILSGTPEP